MDIYESKYREKLIETIIDLLTVVYDMHERTASYKMYKDNASEMYLEVMLNKILSNMDKYQLYIRLENITYNALIDKVYDEIRHYKKYNTSEEDKYKMKFYEDKLNILISLMASKKILDDNYSLIAYFSKHWKDAWTYKFLSSNILWQLRYEMFVNIVKFYPGDLNIFHKSNDDWFKTSERDKEIEDLFDLLKKDKVTRVSIFKSLVNRGEYADIISLNNHFDFSGLSVYVNGREVSVPIIMYRNSKSFKLSNFTIMINSEGYSKKAITDKTDDIMLLLEKCIEFKDIEGVLKNSTFTLNNELINIIAKHYYNELVNYYRPNFNYFKVPPYYYEDHKFTDIYKKRYDIADILIRKARNKAEYIEYQKYVDEFLKLSDYLTIIKTKEKEEKEYNKEIEDKRKELTSLLYNLNDKLGEVYPAKTKIKKIDFKN